MQRQRWKSGRGGCGSRQHGMGSRQVSEARDWGKWSGFHSAQSDGRSDVQPCGGYLLVSLVDATIKSQVKPMQMRRENVEGASAHTLLH